MKKSKKTGKAAVILTVIPVTKKTWHTPPCGPPRAIATQSQKLFLIFFVVGLRMSHPLCYTIRMMIKEAIYKVTIATCWETGSTRAEFIKARDTDHAMRIANRIFTNVISTEFACDCE